MSDGVGHLVMSGPLILAVPVALAAGAVSFISPCVLPLVPGYLSYVTGMSGAGAQRPDREGDGINAGTPDAAGAAVAAGRGTITAAAAVATPAAAPRGRTVAGTALFVLGFSVLFASYGAAFGGLGAMLQTHQQILIQVLGGLTILLGLLFAGAFDRLPLAGRALRPSVRPRARLAGAPLPGVMFGLSWTPCIGPTLAAVLTLAVTTGSAGRGAFLAFVYGLGIGLPFAAGSRRVPAGGAEVLLRPPARRLDHPDRRGDAGHRRGVAGQRSVGGRHNLAEDPLDWRLSAAVLVSTGPAEIVVVERHVLLGWWRSATAPGDHRRGAGQGRSARNPWAPLRRGHSLARPRGPRQLLRLSRPASSSGRPEQASRANGSR